VLKVHKRTTSPPTAKQEDALNLLWLQLQHTSHFECIKDCKAQRVTPTLINLKGFEKLPRGRVYAVDKFFTCTFAISMSRNG